jgi:sugar O-acyltransferase (sialic acid O-acetyltransferase NeuD family)
MESLMKNDSLPVILYGASGHAKVIIEILESYGIIIEEIYDDNPEKRTLLDYKVIPPPVNINLLKAQYVICIGDNSTRKKISEKLNSSFISIFHKGASISKRSTIGEGTVVMGGAQINSDSRIGKHVIINTSASIDHDCYLDDFVHISPNATLSGGVNVGQGAHIGSGAVVIPGIKIGKWATIGAGTVVINDIPDFAVVVGNPGKIIKFRNPQ